MHAGARIIAVLILGFVLGQLDTGAPALGAEIRSERARLTSEYSATISAAQRLQLEGRAGHDAPTLATEDIHRFTVPPRDSRSRSRSPESHWYDGFGHYGLDGAVATLLEWNGDLIAGGEFVRGGHEWMMFVGRWDGSEWSEMPGFVTGIADSIWVGSSSVFHADAVLALAEYEEGVVAAGHFLRERNGERLSSLTRVMHWNGDVWTALGPDFAGRPSDLAVHRGKLYLAGHFQPEDPDVDESLLRWTGEAWVAVEGAPKEPLYALYDDGDSLLVGGRIPSASDSTAYQLRAWDGMSWSNVGPPACRTVTEITRFQGDLIVGGNQYWTCETDPILARLAENGEWVELGSGVSGSVWGHYFAQFWIGGLEVFEDRLIVTGNFRLAGEQEAWGVAAWDGKAWSVFEEGVSSPGHAVGSFRGELAVGGEFTYAGEELVHRIGIHRASEWVPLRRSGGVTGRVESFFPTDDGLIVTGWFNSAGGMPVPGLAVWNGESWSKLGNNLSALTGVRNIVRWREDLYASGFLYVDDGSSWNRTALARFDGETWHAVELGLENLSTERIVVWNDAVAMVGNQWVEGGPSLSVFGVWNGQSLQRIPFADGEYKHVRDMAVYRDRLYVAGTFFSLDGQPASCVAAWDGASWDNLHGGIGGTVSDLGVFEGELVLCGSFIKAVDGTDASGIARWDDSRWGTFGAGFWADTRYLNRRRAIVGGLAWHDGRLHAVGHFDRTVDNLIPRIARWNGETWEWPDSGLGRLATCAASWEGALYVGGNFFEAGGLNSTGVARWAGPPESGWAQRPERGIRLDEIAPNPSNPRTTIAFSLAERGRVRVDVYDVRGRHVTTLLDDVRTAGRHEIQWTATDGRGHGVGSGVYYVRVRGAHDSDESPLTVLR